MRRPYTRTVNNLPAGTIPLPHVTAATRILVPAFRPRSRSPWEQATARVTITPRSSMRSACTLNNINSLPMASWPGPRCQSSHSGSRCAHRNSDLHRGRGSLWDGDTRSKGNVYLAAGTIASSSCITVTCLLRARRLPAVSTHRSFRIRATPPSAPPRRPRLTSPSTPLDRNANCCRPVLR